MIIAYLNVRVAYRETSILTVHHYEKVVKASNIVWFVSSACNLRRHWLECIMHVNKFFFFTGAIDIVLQGSVVRRPINASIIRLLFC